jgi:hypothetical protein
MAAVLDLLLYKYRQTALSKHIFHGNLTARARVSLFERK